MIIINVLMRVLILCFFSVLKIIVVKPYFKFNNNYKFHLFLYDKQCGTWVL